MPILVKREYKCSHCSATGPAFRCPCKNAFYCNRSCQLAGFSNHKPQCATLLAKKIKTKELCLGTSNHATIAEDSQKLALLYSEQGELGKAEGFMRKALCIMLGYGARQEEVAKVRYELGILLREQGKLREALEEHNHALRIRCSLPSLDPHEVAESHIGVGNVFLTLQKPDETFAHFEEAYNMIPTDSPYSAKIRLCIVNAAQQLDTDNSLSLALCERVVGDFDRENGTLAVDGETRALAKLVLASIYIKRNVRFQDAGRMLDSGLQIVREIYPRRHAREGDFLACIGDLYFRQGKHGDALAAFRKAEKVFRQTIGVCASNTINAMFQAGRALLAQGKFSMAATKFEEAVAIRRGIVTDGGDAHATHLLGRDLFSLAVCRQEAGDLSGAVACLRECRGLSGIPERLSSECAAMLAELGVDR